MKLKCDDRGVSLFFPYTSQSFMDFERLLSCMGSYDVWNLRAQMIEAQRKVREELKKSQHALSSPSPDENRMATGRNAL